MLNFKPSITLSLTMLAASLTANALDITDLKAGSLQSRVGDDLTAKSLTVSGTIDASDFAFIADQMSELTSIDLSATTVVAYSGEALPYTSLTISDAATLPRYAFVGMTNLTDVTLPASITAIGTGAFSGTAIKTPILPESVTTIGDYAFMRCQQLSSLTVSSSVKSIGERAFAYCDRLSTLKFGENSALTAISDGAFEGCSSLTDVDLQNLTRCTEIGAWSFAQCDGITTLKLPTVLRSMGTGALLADSSIKGIDLSSTDITSLGDYALTGTSAVKNITLPSTLTAMGDGAMSDMTGLKVIYAEAISQLPELGDEVWNGVNQANVVLVVADDIAETVRATAQWQDFNVMSVTEWERACTLPTIAENVDSLSYSLNGSELTLTTTSDAFTSVALFNTAGTRMAYVNANAQQVTVNVSALQSGVYLVVTNRGIAKIAI